MMVRGRPLDRFIPRMSCSSANPAPPPVKSERWLIFSYFSNVDGMACAQHLDDRLPWLSRFGVVPILVSGVCGERWPDLVHCRVPSIAPSGIRFECRHWLRRRVSRPWLRKTAGLLLTLPCLPFYLLEKLLVDLDSQWSWFLLASRRGRRLCREHRPSVIYSTGGAPSAHLAAALVARWANLPWVAEFQDPLIYPGLRRSRRAIRLYAWLERLVARRASRVVFLTEAARRSFAQRTQVANKGCVIYPGADPEKIPHLPYAKGETCCFAHFGTLAGSRNLSSFLLALRNLLQTYPAWRTQVQVHLYGHLDNAMRDLIRQFPCPGMIIDMAVSPGRQHCRQWCKSDVLLLVQNAGSVSAETIPSKLYEYAFASRPILALIDQNQELRTMLQTQEHYVTEIEADAGIQRAISIWWGIGRRPLPNWRSYRSLPSTLNRLFASWWEQPAKAFPPPTPSLCQAMKEASIIIVSFNGLLETTKPCLESIFEHTDGLDYEIIVVDNASQDATQDFLKQTAAAQPRLRWIGNRSNLGYAAANNLGLAAAQGECLILLNSDTLVTDQSLAKLAAFVRANPEVGLAGPVTNFAGNEQRIFTDTGAIAGILAQGLVWIANSRGDWFETERLGFFCVAMRRNHFAQLGPLDERFGLGFFEDDDYCIRSIKAGCRLVCLEDTFVYHRGSQSFNQHPLAEVKALMKKNRHAARCRNTAGFIRRRAHASVSLTWPGATEPGRRIVSFPDAL